MPIFSKILYYLSPYIKPIYTAVMIYPFLVLLIFIPFTVYQYRKFGQVHSIRSILLYLFLFYVIAIFFLVLLPLPPNPNDIGLDLWLKRYAQNKNPCFNPLNFLMEIFNKNNSRLRVKLLMQATFNFLLLLPFGFFIKYYFKKSVFLCFVFGIVLSLLFEITQITALFGMYPKPYRIFDLSDILLNSLGSLLGGIIAYICIKNKWLKDIDTVKLKKIEYVGIVRRFISTFFDFSLIIASLVPIALVLILNNISLLWLQFPIITAYVFCLIFLPIFLKGSTFGGKITCISIATEKKENPNMVILFVRQIVMWGLFPIIILLGINTHIFDGDSLGSWIVFIFTMLLLIIWCINFLFLLLSKDHKSLFDSRTKLFIINTWKASVKNKK